MRADAIAARSSANRSAPAPRAPAAATSIRRGWGRAGPEGAFARVSREDGARVLSRRRTVAEVAIFAAVDLTLLVISIKDAHLHVDGVLPHSSLLSDAHRHRRARVRTLLVLANRLVDVPLVAPEPSPGSRDPAGRLRRTRDPLVFDTPDIPVAGREGGARPQTRARGYRRATAERTCLPGR